MFEAKQPAQTRTVYGNHITAWDKRVHFVQQKSNKKPAGQNLGGHFFEEARLALGS